MGNSLDVDKFTALSDDARIQILEILSVSTYNVSEITAKTSLARPTISYHLQILRRAGFITAQKEGKETYYSLNRQGLVNIATDILNFSNKNRF